MPRQNRCAAAPDQIDRISITTHPRWLSVCNIKAPETGLEAKFSYAQTAAMRLVGHDTGAIASFTDAICRDKAVKALRGLVKVVEDDRLAETEAEVSLKMRNGALRRLKHDLMAPMPLAQRAEKLGAKAVSLLGDARADALWSAAQGRDLRDLMDQLVMS